MELTRLISLWLEDDATAFFAAGRCFPGRGFEASLSFCLLLLLGLRRRDF